MDKLTLIKSYEQTLRNSGLTPVEDSQIYKLLFRAVHESEHYLAQNRQFVKNRDMANLERLSLMQNQLNLLKVKSRKSSLNFGVRQQHVSCLTQPEIDENSHRQIDPLNY